MCFQGFVLERLLSIETSNFQQEAPSAVKIDDNAKLAAAKDSYAPFVS